MWGRAFAFSIILHHILETDWISSPNQRPKQMLARLPNLWGLCFKSWSCAFIRMLGLAILEWKLTKNNPACKSGVLTQPHRVEPFAADCVPEFSCGRLGPSIATEAIVSTAKDNAFKPFPSIPGRNAFTQSSAWVTAGTSYILVLEVVKTEETYWSMNQIPLQA